MYPTTEEYSFTALTVDSVKVNAGQQYRLPPDNCLRVQGKTNKSNTNSLLLSGGRKLERRRDESLEEETIERLELEQIKTWFGRGEKQQQPPAEFLDSYAYAIYF